MPDLFDVMEYAFAHGVTCTEAEEIIGAPALDDEATGDE